MKKNVIDNPQLANRNLQPPTCNLQPATSNLQLAVYTIRSNLCLSPRPLKEAVAYKLLPREGNKKQAFFHPNCF